MINTGVVKEAVGGILTIEFERHEACGDCHACMHGSENCAKHTIKLPGKADAGDRVEVELDDSHVMAASALAYMVPLAGFVLGLAAGWLASTKLTGLNGDLVMTVFAVAGTALAYLVMRALDPIFSKGRWEPKIISVKKPEEI